MNARPEIALGPPPSIETTPALEPFEVLAAQVEEARRHDTISRLSQYKLGSIAMQGAVLGLVAGEASTFFPFYYLNIDGAAVGLAAAWTVGHNFVDRKKARGRIPEEIAAWEPVGQQYELFRTGHNPGNHKVTMLWHGPLPDTDNTVPGATDSLRETARMAREAGVDTLLIPQTLLVNALPDLPPAYGSMQRWLFRNKQRLVSGGAKHEIVHTNPPEVWEKLAAEAYITEDSVLRGLLEKLRSIYPDHAILRRFDAYEAAGGVIPQKELGTSVRADIGRHLGGVESARGFDPSHPERPFTTLLRYRKTRVGGMPTARGLWAHRSVDGQSDGIGSLSSLLETPVARRAALIEHPELDRERAEPILELAILEELEKLEQRQAVAVSADRMRDTRTEEDLPTPYRQQFVGQKRLGNGQEQSSMRWHWWTRLTGGLLLVATVAYGFSQLHEESNTIENTAYTQINRQLARQAGISPQDILNPVLDPSRIESQVEAEHPLVRITDRIDAWSIDAVNIVNAAYGKPLEPNYYAPSLAFCDTRCPEPPPTAATINGSVGNVGNGQTNDVVWSLQPHDESAAGYWTTYTSDSLLIVGGGYNPVNLQWQPNETVESARPVPTAFNDSGYAHDIRASRKLIAGDTSGEYQGGSVIQTPVLDHNRIVAARLQQDGRILPLEVLAEPGGVEALRLPPNADTSGTLTYWITPANTAVRAVARVHITERGTLPLTLPLAMPAIQRKLAALDPAWLSQSPEARAQAIAGYMSNNFRYALNPLHGGELLGASNLATIVGRELGSRVANCNVANTNISFVDPALNVGVGELDDGSATGQHALLAHDSHLFLVDPTSHIVDGTPGAVSPADQAYFQPSKKQPAPTSPLPWELGGGATILGIAAYRKRREIAMASRDMRLRLAFAAISSLSRKPAKHRFAIELAREVQWRPQPNVVAVGQRVQQGRANVGAVELAIQHPDLHQPANIGRVLRSIPQAPDPRTKIKVIGSARKLSAARIAYNLLPRDLRQPIAKR